MVFGPKESPSQRLRPPCGERCSTTLSASTSSAALSVDRRSSSLNDSRRSSRCSSPSRTHSSTSSSRGDNCNNTDCFFLSSTLQGSFRATRSQGLFLSQQQQQRQQLQEQQQQQQQHQQLEDSLARSKSASSVASKDLLRASTSLRSTGASVSANVEKLKGSSAAASSAAAAAAAATAESTERIPCSSFLSSHRSSTADLSSTIQGTFRATKSQGLQRQPSACSPSQCNKVVQWSSGPRSTGGGDASGAGRTKENKQTTQTDSLTGCSCKISTSDLRCTDTSDRREKRDSAPAANSGTHRRSREQYTNPEDAHRSSTKQEAFDAHCSSCRGVSNTNRIGAASSKKPLPVESSLLLSTNSSRGYCSR